MPDHWTFFEFVTAVKKNALALGKCSEAIAMIATNAQLLQLANYPRTSKRTRAYLGGLLIQDELGN